MPGTWKNHASGLAEWNGPPLTPPPDGPRMTIGAGAPHRQLLLAQAFTIWLCAELMKSMNWNSATGRMPVSDAPKAALTIAASEMGVSMTRSLPKWLMNP